MISIIFLLWKSRDFVVFGKFWGVEAGDWLSLIAAVLSAALAATIAIYVLRNQNNHQAEQARLDREEQARQAERDRAHQAELSRMDREISTLAELRTKTNSYIKMQQFTHLSHERPENFDSYTISEMTDARADFTNELYKWAINSGLPWADAESIINTMQSLVSNYTMETVIGETIDNPEFFKAANAVIETLMKSAHLSPVEKWSMLVQHVSDFDANNKASLKKLRDQGFYMVGFFV